MNRKRWIMISIIAILILAIGGGLYYYFGKEDDKTTLTLAEKKWIESNKNNIIDIGVVNDIPIFNYDGEGFIFDFLADIEKDTGLEFNEISYDYGTASNTVYTFGILDKVSDNNVLVYEDNYAIVSTKENLYSRLEDIPTMVLGVTKDNLENINFYLYDNKNITYKVFENDQELFSEITSTTSSVQGIVVPKAMDMSQIISNKLHINYNITDAKVHVGFTLGTEKKLNIIIKKYYQKWKQQNYKEVYNKYFLNNYFSFNKIYKEEIAKFSGKQYQYGFINYAPFTTLIDGNLVGISSEYLKNIADMAGIEIKYNEYKSLHDLIKDFNENKIDLFFDTSSEKQYNMDVYQTASMTDEQIVIVSSEDYNLSVQSLSSLKEQEVIVIAGSKVATYLKGYGIRTKEVNNFENIISRLNKNSIIAMDEKAFDIYRHKELENYKIDYRFNLNSDYNYTIRDIKDNQIFEEFFNFYISFVDAKSITNNVTHHLYATEVKNHFLYYTRILLIIILIILVIWLIIRKPFKFHKKEHISKDNKLKYIDMLTSLKNRNYLNEAMEKWDNSEIYPQAIVIVDLNNIAYINDNYGHEEGDNVIKQAANILITTQIENSEIMRTNGNEFLIYMVEHDEKQIISYIRKLNKELKDLSHGFGAAVGYSMIIDGLKTVDDAINEATLDMKSNKEEINN